MRDAGMVATDEPASNLLCQGMVVADTYYRENADGCWVRAHEGATTSARLSTRRIDE